MRCGNASVLKVLQDDKYRTKAMFTVSKVYYIMENLNFFIISVSI